MKDLLFFATCASLFLLCTLGEATPDARSVTQMWDALHRAGAARTFFAAARVAVVLILFIFADLCRLACCVVQGVRIAAEALAVHAEILGAPVTWMEVRAWP